MRAPSKFRYFLATDWQHFCADYKRCTAELNWLMGACSHADRFKRSCIARQRDMSMK